MSFVIVTVKEIEFWLCVSLINNFWSKIDLMKSLYFYVKNP